MVFVLSEVIGSKWQPAARRDALAAHPDAFVRKVLRSTLASYKQAAMLLTFP
jgi:hypothetical protein